MFGVVVGSTPGSKAQAKGQFAAVLQQAEELESVSVGVHDVGARELGGGHLAEKAAHAMESHVHRIQRYERVDQAHRAFFEQVSGRLAPIVADDRRLGIEAARTIDSGAAQSLAAGQSGVAVEQDQVAGPVTEHVVDRSVGDRCGAKGVRV